MTKTYKKQEYKPDPLLDYAGFDMLTREFEQDSEDKRRVANMIEACERYVTNMTRSKRFARNFVKAFIWKLQKIRAKNEKLIIEVC